MFSLHSQKIFLSWSIAFSAIWFVALYFGLRMFPPPGPNWTTDEIARFYQDHTLAIRLGAMLTAYTGAFLVPLTMVLAAQIHRFEQTATRHFPIWSMTTAIGGGLMSVVVVFPCMFWGVAAYAPDRSPEVTAIMHQLGCLTFVTADQYFIFVLVPVAFMALKPRLVTNSPFTRWYGYLTIWTALTFEAGAIAYLTHTGPFAWNGLLAFWIPLVMFGAWVSVTYVLLFKAIALQIKDDRPEVSALDVTCD